VFLWFGMFMLTLVILSKHWVGFFIVIAEWKNWKQILIDESRFIYVYIRYIRISHGTRHTKEKVRPGRSKRPERWIHNLSGLTEWERPGGGPGVDRWWRERGKQSNQTILHPMVYWTAGAMPNNASPIESIF
jgi:hypothetical protein